MDFEDSDGVVERVWEDVVLAGVSDGVLPHRRVPVYGGCEVWSILGNSCACGRVGCEDSSLEILEPVCFRVFSPYAL